MGPSWSDTRPMLLVSPWEVPPLTLPTANPYRSLNMVGLPPTYPHRPKVPGSDIVPR